VDALAHELKVGVMQLLYKIFAQLIDRKPSSYSLSNFEIPLNCFALPSKAGT
jgi:hypothetical protein